MSDEGDNNFVRYIYRGEDGEQIPLHATHVIVHELTTDVRAYAFFEHQNIVEVVCHNKVEKIEEWAFYCCPSLRRVTMPGVTIIEYHAFLECEALTDVECGKLERIQGGAFSLCNSLRSINLPSAEIVKDCAFNCCDALTDVKFGSKLERIEGRAFNGCDFLERITIPLKEDIFDDYDIFSGCVALNRIDLAEGVLLKTVSALHFDSWRNDMNREIDSINQILPNTPAGNGMFDDGEKSEVIQEWISSVLAEIFRYKAEHQRVLAEAADTLERALPRDIVIKNVLSFLTLPS